MKILFVEDDHNISIIAKLVFVNTSHDVILSPSPSCAIKALDVDDFDVIILDMTFPIGSGEDVLSYMVENNIDIPVFIHSGYVTKYEAIIKYYTEMGIIKKVYHKSMATIGEIIEDINSLTNS